MPVSEELRASSKLLGAAAVAARSQEAAEFDIIVAFWREGRPRATGFKNQSDALDFLKRKGIEYSDAVVIDRRRNDHIIWMT
jgi:hypothetical protein